MPAVSVTGEPTTESWQIEKGSRVMVRTSEGVLYAALTDATNIQIHMYKSSDHGASWASVDSLDGAIVMGNHFDNPVATSICIDANDLIHLIFYNHLVTGLGSNNFGLGLNYASFDPSTDTFSATELVAGQTVASSIPTNPGTAIAIADGNLQIAYVDLTTSRVGNIDTVLYVNGVTTSWSTPISVQSNAMWPDIIIERIGTKVPYVTCVTAAGNSVMAVGNGVNATGFSANSTGSVATTFGFNRPQIVQDHVGNHYVAAVDGSNRINMAKHTVGTSFGTWVSAKATSTIYQVYAPLAFASRGYASGRRDKSIVFWAYGVLLEASLSTVTDFHTHPTETWPTDPITLPPTEAGPTLIASAKWSNYHDHGGRNRMDYLFKDLDEIFYDYLDLNQPIF